MKLILNHSEAIEIIAKSLGVNKNSITISNNPSLITYLEEHESDVRSLINREIHSDVTDSN